MNRQASFFRVCVRVSFLVSHTISFLSMSLTYMNECKINEARLKRTKTTLKEIQIELTFNWKCISNALPEIEKYETRENAEP